LQQQQRTIVELPVNDDLTDKKFFKLVGDELQFFDSPNGEKKGSLSIKQHVILVTSNEQNNSFTLHTYSAKEFEFNTPNKEQMNLWVNRINQILSSK